MQIFYWTGLVVISALLGFVIAPKAAKTLGKKKAVMVLGVLAFSIQPLPVLLRLLNVLPENGTPLLFPLVATINTLDLGLIIAMQIVSASMIADLVEQSELATGRRSEGVFFSTLTFVRKTNQGIGVFIAGIVLAAVQFPEGASPAEVDTAIMWNLGAVLVPIQWLLWALMLWALAYYRLNKTEHESNLLSLGRR
jgi:Na+/melibiose symporter-like transporter